MSKAEKPSLLIAPGQGSQRAKLWELAERFDDVAETYKLADSISIELFGPGMVEGRSISEHSALTPTEELSANTAITQPLIVATSIGLIKHLKKSEEYVTAYGHSLGEISALFAAGSLSEYDALKLAMIRGIHSQEAAKQRPGGMVVLFNLPAELKERLLNSPQDEDEVAISTDNSPDQITISGPRDKVYKYAENIRSQYQKVIGLSKEEKRKLPNAVVMKIGAAFHHAMMKPAQRAFRQALDEADLQIPAEMNWFSNHSHTYEASPDVIRSHLENQMVSPVRFWHDIGKLITDGHVRIVESGAGTVISDGLKEQQLKQRLPETLEILSFEKDIVPSTV